MAKIRVCDICLHEGKLRKSRKYWSIKNQPHMRLDYCPEHAGVIPKGIENYKKFVRMIKGY